MRSVGLAAVATAVVLGACTPAGPPRTALAPTESWCPEGFEVGPDDACFAVPESHGKDTPVLVYLHGMYKGHGSPEEWALVRTAAAKGFAVVVPRGKRGLCAWKAELSDHFCWPHEPEDPQSFRAVVAEWDRVLWQVEAVLEGGPHKRYVLGYSNGGFFAAHLAASGFFKADAWGLVNAGALDSAPAPWKGGGPPMLLVAAEGDSEEGPRVKALHGELTRARAAHAFCTRPGDHALAQADVDGALSFFRRHAAGALKAQAGSYACESPLKPAGP